MAKKMTLMDAFPIYGYEYPILVSKERGCLGIPLRLELPEVYTLDEGDYLTLNRLVSGIIEIMGENCLLHKQDMFFGEKYTMDRERLERDFFEAEDEWYFRDRPYLEHRCFLTLHKVPKIISTGPHKGRISICARAESTFSTIMSPENIWIPRSRPTLSPGSGR